MPRIVGRKDRFAIEASIEETVDGWVLGKFRFWLCGEPVGDWEDSADLKGGVGWLDDFATKPRDRFEASLQGLSAEDVFRRIYDPVMIPGAKPATIEDPFSRFHIVHLGMSSFERVDMLLVKDERGGERCLWRRAGSDAVRECFLWRNEMEGVAAEFCRVFESELPREQ